MIGVSLPSVPGAGTDAHRHLPQRAQKWARTAFDTARRLMIVTIGAGASGNCLINPGAPYFERNSRIGPTNRRSQVAALLNSLRVARNEKNNSTIAPLPALFLSKKARSAGKPLKSKTFYSVKKHGLFTVVDASFKSISIRLNLGARDAELMGARI